MRTINNHVGENVDVLRTYALYLNNAIHGLEDRKELEKMQMMDMVEKVVDNWLIGRYHLCEAMGHLCYIHQHYIGNMEGNLQQKEIA